MKHYINLKIRLNPYTVTAIIGAICTALHVNPSGITSWAILFELLKDLLGNPFLLLTTAMTIVGIIHDPTTKGLGDSEKALNYKKPN